MGTESSFSFYFQHGFEHISDLTAYDHILFIVALCAMYRPKEWKTIAILVTAFTVGHSLSLAASVLEWVTVSVAWVEFLIPVTILLTCLYNISTFRTESLNAEQPTAVTKARKALGKPSVSVKYFLALFFGFIHGLGFSNYLNMMLSEEESLLEALFAFNLGLELGQLLIVGVILLLAALFLELLRVQQRSWNLFISGGAFGIALVLAVETAAAL